MMLNDAASMLTTRNEKLTQLVESFYDYEEAQKNYATLIRQPIAPFLGKNSSLSIALKHRIDTFNNEPLIRSYHRAILQRLSFFKKNDYYAYLNIVPGASFPEIQKAYTLMCQHATNKDRHQPHHVAFSVLHDNKCRDLYQNLYAYIEEFLTAYNRVGLYFLCAYSDYYLQKIIDRCTMLSTRNIHMPSLHVLKVLLQQLISLCEDELTLRKDSQVYQAYLSCVSLAEQCELFYSASNAPDKDDNPLIISAPQNSPAPKSSS